jgi:type IV fimbrial biogenesis protein FimT
MVAHRENRGAGAAGGKHARASQLGFTLIEVMVVVIIVAILLAVAAPGYRELIGNNRIVSEVYALRATLSHARTEALARRASVVVCPTTDGAACADSDDWSTGYLVFVDTDGDGAADPTDPDEEIIQRETDERSVDIEFDNPARLVRFGANGIALGFEGIFTFCDDRGAQKARGLILNPVGSLRAATDTDTPEDFIVDDVDDSNVTCN